MINNSIESLIIPPQQIVSSGDWNLVSKELDSSVTNFINFDQTTYEYREFAFDEDKIMSTIEKSNFLNSENITTEEISAIKNSDNSISLITKGYNPNSSENMSSVLTTKSVIGGIDGRKLVSDTTQWPYRAAGYVKMIYNVLDNETGLLKSRKYVGSAFLEGPDLLVTAGHCVYGDVTTSYETKDGVIHTEFEDYLNNFRFPDEMIYYPAQNGLNYQSYGQVSVDRVYIEKSYYLNTKKDWACAKLSNSIGDQTGWLGKIADFYKENQSFISFGYPGSKEGEMYVAEAQFTQFEDNGWYYRTNLDSEGGQSGSPYRVTLDLGESYVSGIHTYSVGSSYSGGN